MESLHRERKRTPLMEEAKKVKRESDRNRGKTKVNRRAFTLCRALVLSQSLCPILLIHCCFYFCLALDSNQAASGSHVANAKFATATPTVDTGEL